MIATLDEIKAILGITGTEFDNDIQTQMPLVQDYIIEYTKNDFASDNVLLNFTSSTIIFNSANKKIIDSTGGMITNSRLLGSENIVVSYSLLNNYHFTVSTTTAITDTEIVVEEDLTEETNQDNIYITIRAVVFPKSLKNIYASMINTKINSGTTNNANNIKKKKLDDFEIEYNTENLKDGYLKTDLEALNKFRKHRK